MSSSTSGAKSQGDIIIVAQEVREGVASPLVPLLRDAWAELPELQVRPLGEYIMDSVALAARFNRIEAAAFTEDHSLVGVAVFVVDLDIHVGVCLSVMHQYVAPAYRHAGISKRFMRLLLRIAKEQGFPYVSFTHRKGVGKYEVNYRRVANG